MLSISIITLSVPLRPGDVDHHSHKHTNSRYCERHGCAGWTDQWLRTDTEQLVVLLFAVCAGYACLFLISGGKLWRSLLETACVYEKGKPKQILPSLKSATRLWKRKLKERRGTCLRATSFHFYESLDPSCRHLLSHGNGNGGGAGNQTEYRSTYAGGLERHYC